VIELERFTSVSFRNFKAFKQYSIALSSFNVLVGPNNAGKSTVITAFRILAEAMRKAKAKAPELLRGPTGDAFGYRVSLAELPVAAENIFSDYDDSEPASINFRISNGNHLILQFPEREVCNMFADSVGKAVRTPSAFRTNFNCEVAFVPVLGPVEHNEPLFQKEAARLALITHRASRNFRNIWYHYPDRFSEFRALLQRTWPGMDIELPKLDRSGDRTLLHMFAVEDRLPRELYWSGFGFQVWCQMLTFIVEGQRASLLAIDEPDIYLHSDLQRQLLSILKEIGSDILLATHSTELVSGADPSDIVVVTRGSRSAKRLKDPSQLQAVFTTLGSNLNPTLTQLAKSRRALFVEGKDFQIISWFAERLGRDRVANDRVLRLFLRRDSTRRESQRSPRESRQRSARPF
jgi:energy-coupling factor transporter ATP-binding protein EcfA2